MSANVEPDKRPVRRREIKDMTAKQKLALLRKIAPSFHKPKLKKKRTHIVIDIER